MCDAGDIVTEHAVLFNGIMVTGGAGQRLTIRVGLIAFGTS